MGRLLGKLKGILNISRRDATSFVASLLLAFGIWLLYNLSLEGYSVVSVSVTAVSNIEGHAEESSNSSVITARCHASGLDILKMKGKANKTVKVFFSSSDLHSQEPELYTISSSDLDNYKKDIFGDNISVESFISSQVQFRFPVENHKKVPVQSVATLSYKSQYAAMGEMKIEPDSITIYGEPFHVDKVERVYTRPISLQELKSSAHGVAKLEQVSGIRYSDDIVNYSINVTRYVEISDNLQVVVKNAPAGKHLSVYPSKADVVFRCAFPLTSDPTGKATLYVDYNDFANSINGRCVARISSLPQGVISYEISPQVFECLETANR